MRDLAHLSDKYIIESLRKDIRVQEFWLTFSLQIYLKSGIFVKESPTLELWEFAARHSFDEMEQYCRRDPNVALQIDSIISDPKKGLEYLLSRHLAVPFVSRLVSSILTRRARDVGWLRHCLTTPTDTCRPAPTAIRSSGFGRPPIGQNNVGQNNIGQDIEHMKEYHDSVRKGRFNYASDGKVDCVVCFDILSPADMTQYS